MTKMILTVTLLFAGAAILPAQNMTADIPFGFQIPGKSLPAGTYEVAPWTGVNGFNHFLFRELNSNRGYLVSAPVNVAAGSHVGTSKLVFRCESDTCELAQITSAQRGMTVGVPRSVKRRNGATGTEIAAMFVEIAAN